MRSLKNNRGKAVSRTGVRAVRAKAKKKSISRIEPGRRRNPAAERKFGRRSSRPDSFVKRWLDDVRENGSFGMVPFSIATMLLIVAVVFYGLVVGGHVSAAGNDVVNRANKLLAFAGFTNGWMWKICPTSPPSWKM